MTDSLELPLLWAAMAIIVLAGCYNTVLFLLSRIHIRRSRIPGAERFYVFLLACLNEEKVLAESLARITSLPGGNFIALVIDDASQDRTAEIAGSTGNPRVRLYRRRMPDARRGKGAALNAGVRHLRASGLLGHRDPGEVVLCVVDADGRLDPHVLQAVDPFFDDPRTGGVQIGVRMYNRGRGCWPGCRTWSSWSTATSSRAPAASSAASAWAATASSCGCRPWTRSAATARGATA